VLEGVVGRGVFVVVFVVHDVSSHLLPLGCDDDFDDDDGFEKGTFSSPTLHPTVSEDKCYLRGYDDEDEHHVDDDDQD
jgi:hypothetical protein